MEKKEYSFPVTYRIVDEPSPLEIPDSSEAYLIDKKRNILGKSKEIQDWDHEEVTQLYG